MAESGGRRFCRGLGQIPPGECSFAWPTALEQERRRGIFGKDVIVPDSAIGSNLQGSSFPVDHVALLKQIQVLRGMCDLQVPLANVVSRCKAGEGTGIAKAIVAISAIEVMSRNKFDAKLLHLPEIDGGRA